MPSTPPRSLLGVLTEEHVLIHRALALFARYSEQVFSGDGYDPHLARRFLRFFRDFGDLRHHQKEEEILFPWMAALGLPPGDGPLAVLSQEHEVGRDLRLALSLATDALLESPQEGDARERFRSLALRYVELMTAHIEKEEQVLFPLAERFARQSGQELRRADELPATELSWIEGLELQAASWPSASLSLRGLGTPYGFERLCEESLR